MRVLMLSGRGSPEELRSVLPSAIEIKVLDQPSEEQLIAEVGEVKVLFAGNERISERVISAAPRLRFIQTPTGYDNVDVQAATRKGVFVANTGVNSSAVAELVVFFMFYLTRGMWRYRQQLETSQRAPQKTAGEVGEKVMGLVGFGRIGREVAWRGKALKMRVLASDPYVSSEDIVEAGVEPAGFENMLREADFVSLHCPLTAETRELIGKRELALMSPTAFLINTARGGLIDEAALAEAIQECRLAGAGLDVLAKEPPEPGNPLLRLSNVLITPHIGGRTREATARTHGLIAENILKVNRGGVPRNIVNPEVLTRRACHG